MLPLASDVRIQISCLTVKMCPVHFFPLRTVQVRCWYDDSLEGLILKVVALVEVLDWEGHILKLKVVCCQLPDFKVKCKELGSWSTGFTCYSTIGLILVWVYLCILQFMNDRLLHIAGHATSWQCPQNLWNFPMCHAALVVAKPLHCCACS